MKILESLRLELDGSRRDHVNIENKIAKQEAKQNEVDAKHTTHIQSKDASVAGNYPFLCNHRSWSDLGVRQIDKDGIHVL